MKILARLLLAVSYVFSILATRIHAAAASISSTSQAGNSQYVEYGGVGILVFDIEDEYKFVRRIPTLGRFTRQKA